jgi:diguanylate cyclase (GGDEF)-like protein/PAS domain S-box-containing protein
MTADARWAPLRGLLVIVAGVALAIGCALAGLEVSWAGAGLPSGAAPFRLDVAVAVPVGAILAAAVWLALRARRQAAVARQRLEAVIAANDASEERWRQLARLSSDWYWEQDAQFRFTRIEGALERHAQIHVAEVVGKARWELPATNIGAGGWAAHRARLEARQPFRDFVIGRIGGDGEPYWVSVSGDPVFDAAGAFVGYRGVGSDITQRRRAEEALLESNSRLLALVEAIPDAIVFKDGAGRWRVANEPAQRLFGLHGVDWQARTDAELAAARPALASTHEHCQASDEAAWNARRLTLVEETVDDERGEPRLFDVRKVPLFEADGRRRALVIVATDATERKRAERQLQESVALNASVLNALSEHIAVIDRNGIIVTVNAAWRRFAASHGAPEQVVDSIGLDYRNVCLSAARTPGGEDAATAWAGIEGVLGGTRDRFWFEYPCAAPEGELWFRMTAYPLAMSGGGAVIAHEDITERKRADELVRVAAKVFEAEEGMMITDAMSVIRRVNHAFTVITGYQADEVVGKTPRILKSDRHGAEFFAQMWERIRHEGAWSGEVWNRRRNGEVYPQYLTVTAVHGDNGVVTHYVGTFTDITRRKAAEAEIEYLAFFDPLTQLPNRRLLLDRLQHALAASGRSGNQGALLFIDLDNFKTLNDSRGHAVGDLLLRQMAQALIGCVREGDTVARLGGDEYVVMLEDLGDSPEEAAGRAEVIGRKILGAVGEPMQLAGHEHHSSASIGVTLFSGVGDTVEELLKRADMAMYRAKAAGRNTLRFFDPMMQATVAARAALETDLRRGIREGQFDLHYQPQVDRNGRMLGAEALLRWRHPTRGAIDPVEFVGPAEESGLIVPLGQWVIETACAELATWSRLPWARDVKLAVNVSPREFHHPDFVCHVLAVIDRTGADPRRLMLEFTEGTLLVDIDDVVAKMTALKARGIGFAIDDFGTGYSSLSYLKHLPLDQLKIDRSFVHDLGVDGSNTTIAQAIVALGKSLGLVVVAEGVETTGQHTVLQRLGCDVYQGYLFGAPGPAAGLRHHAQASAPPPAPGERASATTQ